MSATSPGAAPGGDVRGAKANLRARMRRVRAARTLDHRRDADAARTDLLLRAIDPSARVACYLSTGDEPGTFDLVERLAARGTRVLVPLLAGRHDPAWAAYRGRHALRPGLWGIPEPIDDDDGATVLLSEADLVLCSGLAATLDGRRLGVGGGWYDRALGAARPGVPVWILLDEADIVGDLPTEPHDRRVDAIATQSAIIPASP